MHVATGNRGYLWYLAKTQLTFLAHFVILKLHIWESSLTVRLSNPHMRKQENMVEKMERNM